MADENTLHAALPEDLRSHPSLKDFKDPVALARSYIDTKALVGASLRPPGPDATPEARTEFVTKLREKVPELVLIPDGDDEPAQQAREAALQRLGKPKEAKAYELPKDVELSKDNLEALREEAFEEGLTKAQFQARAKRVAGAFAEASQAQREGVAALRRELGAAFDERTAAAAAVAAKLGFPAAVVSALKEGTVDVATFKAFSSVAKGFGEARHVADQGPGGGGTLTPAEAVAQREEIMARPEYFNPTQAQLGIHRNLVDKVRALNEIIDA